MLMEPSGKSCRVETHHLWVAFSLSIWCRHRACS
jgi:hypothetical protein